MPLNVILSEEVQCVLSHLLYISEILFISILEQEKKLNSQHNPTKKKLGKVLQTWEIVMADMYCAHPQTVTAEAPGLTMTLERSVTKVFTL